MTLASLIDAIRTAHVEHRPLRLRGHGTKDFYGGMLAGEVLDVSAHRGIVAYEPTELYVTARAGTPLAEIEAALAEQGQMLAFEPPHFAVDGPAGPETIGATLGGCIAAGLSGPRRPQVGAVRDFVLGLRLVDGRGTLLNFGGQVMKNVAGYDVSRLMAGSLGTLGLIAEATLKVLPRPVAEQTLRFELAAGDACKAMNQWGGRPLPVSATFWAAGVLHVRLSGAGAAVEAARRTLGGELVEQATARDFWATVREQTHPALGGQPLWRVAVPTTAPDLGLDDLCTIEWGGGLRWYGGEQPAIRGAAARAGGHATLYRAPESLRCREGAFSPLSPALLALHRRLKQAFDPAGIFNPGRLYAEL